MVNLRSSLLHRSRGLRFASEVTPAAALGLVWAAFWWPLVAGRELHFLRDLSGFALPAKTYLVERLSALELPLWTPHFGAGMPFFADVSNQALYFPNLLVLIAPSPAHGLTWFVLAHSLFGMLAFYALARALAVGPVAAAWSAIAYGLSGYVLSISDNVVYLPAVVWVPLGFRIFLIALARRSHVHTPLLALCLSQLVFAGDALNSVGLVAGIVLLGFHSGDRRRFAAAHLTIALVLCALVVAVQVLPTLELTAHSVRAAPLPFDEASTWSFPPMRLLEFVQLFFFGSNYPVPTLLDPGLYPVSRSPWADSVYLGLATVGLAIVGAVTGPRRAWPWLLIGAVALALSFGRHLPYYQQIASLPFLGSQRYPEKFIFWATLSVCLLAAFGAQRLLSNPLSLQSIPARRRTFIACLISLLLLAGMIAGVHLAGRLLVWEGSAAHSLFWSQRLPGSWLWREGALAHSALVSIGLVACMWWGRRWSRASVVALLGLAVGDLAWVHYRHLPTMPQGLLHHAPPPRAVAALAARGPVEASRVFFDGNTPTVDARMMNGALASKIREAAPGPWQAHTWLYSSLFSRERLKPNRGAPYGVHYLNDQLIPLRLQRGAALRSYFEAHDMHTLLAASSVRHVLTPRDPINPRWSGPGFVKVAISEEGNLRLLEVRGALPEAYLATRVRPARPPPVGFDDLASIVGTANAAIVEAPSGVLAAVRANTEEDGRVSIALREAERYVFEVASPHPGALLVVDTSYFPGWRAWRDGQPTPIYPANYRFMSVFVPRGEHRVELVYRSTHLTLGAALSGLGVAIVIAWLVLALSCRLGSSGAGGRRFLRRTGEALGLGHPGRGVRPDHA